MRRLSSFSHQNALMWMYGYDNIGSPFELTGKVTARQAYPTLASYNLEPETPNTVFQLPGFARQATKAKLKVKQKKKHNTERNIIKFKGEDGFRLKVKVDLPALSVPFEEISSLPTLSELKEEGLEEESWYYDPVPISASGGTVTLPDGTETVEIDSIPLFGSDDVMELYHGFFRARMDITENPLDKIVHLEGSDCDELPTGFCKPGALATLVVDGMPLNIMDVYRVVSIRYQQMMFAHNREVLAGPEHDHDDDDDD